MTGRREVLPLKTDTGRLFTINREYLSDLVRELETFLEGEDFMNNRTFSKKVLFTQSIMMKTMSDIVLWKPMIKVL